MERIRTLPIPGVKVYRMHTHKDNRGKFTEAYTYKVKAPYSVYHVNIVESKKGTIRGLHYQKPPFTQSKLVSCVKGKVKDVIIDLREGKNKYKVTSIILSEDNDLAVYIPSGCAHGYEALEDSILSYIVNNEYSPKHSKAIHYKSPKLNIDWDTKEPIVSKKDKEAPMLK